MVGQAVSNTFIDFWDSISHPGLIFPAFIQGKVMSLYTTQYTMLCHYSSETCSFLNRNGGRVDGDGQTGSAGEGQREEERGET